MPNSTLSSHNWRRAWAERSRRDPDDAWAWAMSHRGHGAEGLLRDIPALHAIANDRSELVVIQKSAQVGLTELLVNLALWGAATTYAGRGHMLYLMPTAGQMADCAHARIDHAIQGSPDLRALLHPEPPRRKGADSVRLKHLGPGYIYMRGADDARQISSVDADIVFADEFDFMHDGTFDLMLKRIASSQAGRVVLASTPRFPETGVNALYLQSDQHRYFLTCTVCSTEQALSWEQNVDQVRAVIVCARCGAPLDTASAGRWLPTAPGNAIRGYQLSRLYSPWLNLPAMIAASQSPTASGLQEFYNSDLGEPFVAPGGGLSLAVLDGCRAPYSTAQYAGQRCVMGVDVGTNLHVVIRECPEQPSQDTTSPRPLWFAGILPGGDWSALDRLVAEYHVAAVVVDAQPELHQAAAFVTRYPYTAAVARYSRTQSGVDRLPPHDDQPYTLALNRTEAIERTFQRFHDGVAQLPAGARELGGSVRRGSGEYYRELGALRRAPAQDAQGNWTARWVDGGGADHFAHAEVYCLYAETLVMAPPLGPVMLVTRSRWRSYGDER